MRNKRFFIVLVGALAIRTAGRGFSQPLPVECSGLHKESYARRCCEGRDSRRHQDHCGTGNDGPVSEGVNS